MSYRVGVVGAGPRGLGALEALVFSLSQAKMDCLVDVFDPTEHPGAGPNFCPDQSDLCLLNIPVRALDIAPLKFSGSEAGTFESWSKTAFDPNAFPPRSDIGRYLHARFLSLQHYMGRPEGITDIRAHISQAYQRDGSWWLVSDGHEHGPYSEILLAQGQPQTALDPQMDRWQAHAKENCLDLLPAYPANRLLSAASAWAGKTVAIRGLGLSTLDVVRLLTIGVGGRFEDGGYIASGKEPRRIMPFSLDGHPPVPKPQTAELDALFDPNAAETRNFEFALEQAVSRAPEQALQCICDAIVAPATRILSACDGTNGQPAVEEWLKQEVAQPGSQANGAALDVLKTGIDMALGRALPTAGYVVGQIWRKWQNELRQGVNTSAHRPDTMKAIIGFDEGLKRFSYGPPVSSAQELLILAQAGIVDMQVVDDPNVIMNDDGWRLIDDDVSSQVSVMIDAVISSPDLSTVTEPLLSSLRECGAVVVVAEGLGARTNADGQIVGSDGETKPGLYLLGRQALGSVIAADSLHDCFGASATRWAQGVVDRVQTDDRFAAVADAPKTASL